MDQTSTHFQHSTQLGADLTSNGVKLFSQPIQTQFSVTRQDLTTEPGMVENPYYMILPNTRIDSATGSMRYTKDLGADFGRITSLNVSGKTSVQTDSYTTDYLSQQGVQGDVRKEQDQVVVASTYDAPAKVLSFPIGSNQFTQTLSLTEDRQDFKKTTNLYNYDRTTLAQTYGWTNTSELIKDLVFTPGFIYSITNVKGNTGSPGTASSVDQYVTFQEQVQPKGGLVYRGIPGVIPSVTYSGSNLYDYYSYLDGERLNITNSINYNLSLNPGSWLPIFQQMGLNVTGGRTESSTASIPNYSGQGVGTLSDEDRWLIKKPRNDIALTGSLTSSDQLNGSFKILDTIDFRPTGTWTTQFNLLSKGSDFVEQDSQTYGLSTNYGKRLLAIPWVNFNVNSVQLQYTHTENFQIVNNDHANPANHTKSDLYGVTFPYDINKQAQGNVRFQQTNGLQYGLSTASQSVTLSDQQVSAEYIQKFAPNLELHIPFTHWKIKLQDAIEFRATFFADFVKNESGGKDSFNDAESQKYRGTIELNYNALKNLRVGLSLINEYYDDKKPNLSYSLWQINLSGEAKF
jgi:hypothetical protein